MTLLDKTLSALGLMRVAEHDCDLCGNMREVPDSAGLRSYQETAPCPKCRDGSWSYQAAKRWHRKFLTAVTYLEKEEGKIEQLRDMMTAKNRLVIELGAKCEALRHDAEKWRNKLARDAEYKRRKRGDA